MITIKNLAYILLGVLLLLASSQISIPMQPVPLTLQTVGVMLIGLIFTRTLAVQTVLFYLALGAIGLPVFANYRGGWKILFGPTGGYLWGFLVAVLLMTSLRRHLKNRYFLQVFANCLLGTIVILMCGVLWLAYYVGIETASKSGLYPFIIPGMLKVLLTTVIVWCGFQCDYSIVNDKKVEVLK